MSQKAYILVNKKELETEQFHDALRKLSSIGAFFFLNNINKHFQYWVFECEKVNKELLNELGFDDYFVQ